MTHKRMAADKLPWMPRYTVDNLTDELDYYSPQILLLYVNNVGVEVHRDLVIGLLKEDGAKAGNSTSILILSVPRPGVGVLIANPRFKRRKRRASRRSQSTPDQLWSGANDLTMGLSLTFFTQ